MFAKSRSLVGLDIGASMVKAIEFSVDRGNIFLSGYGSAPCSSPENIEPAIREALAKGGITSRRVCTSVSGRKVVVRYFPVPGGLNEGALKAEVESQAPNYIPFDLSQVEKDFYPVSISDETGTVTTKVILVAVKSEEIEERVRLLRNCGLIPSIIDIDTFAVGNAFEIWAQLKNMTIGNKVTGLVDIGYSKTTINIIQGSVSNFSREVYIGSQDMVIAIAKRFGQSEHESAELLKNPRDNYDAIKEAITSTLEDIGNEIRLSIDFYENQFETEVSEIYVSGGITRFAGLVDLLGQIFFLPTLSWDPVEGMQLGPNVDADSLRENAAHLSVAVGLASRIRGV